MSLSRLKKYDWILATVAFIVCVAGVVNFYTFLNQSSQLGGDAINGYEQNGHYYVCAHGTCAEVPKSTWEQNRIQGIILFTAWPLVLASGAYLGECWIKNGRVLEAISKRGRPNQRE